MTPLAWILSFVLPACGVEGAGGLPAPQPMDMAYIERPASPNTALVTQAYAMPAPRLYAAVRAIAEARTDTHLAAEFPDRLQVHYVVRSILFNFPDLVTVQATATGPAASALTLYSRSVYGHSDLGANRKRIEAWLAALPAPTR